MREIRGNDISMIFQEPMTSLNPVFTIGMQISEAIIKQQNKTPEEAREISLEMLKLVRIPEPDKQLEQYPHQLSGGQRQTLAIARAIYFGAKILILDEPTSALGQKQQMEVLKTIKKVQRLGNIAIILITHNEIHARLIADRYTFLSLGEVIGSGLSSELGGDDVKRLMAGGAEIGDLAKELEL